MMIKIGGRGSLKKARVRGIPPQCNVPVGGMRKGTASLSTMHMWAMNWLTA